MVHLHDHAIVLHGIEWSMHVACMIHAWNPKSQKTELKYKTVYRTIGSYQ